MPPQGGRKHPHQEFIQIDTSNILFICGGAFDGLEKIIESRIGKKSIGFGADVFGQKETDLGELLRQVLPEDFVKFRSDSRVHWTSSSECIFKSIG